MIPKKSLTGDNTERVDTRALQVLYALPVQSPAKVYVGQQMEVFLEAAESDRYLSRSQNPGAEGVEFAERSPGQPASERKDRFFVEFLGLRPELVVRFSEPASAPAPSLRNQIIIERFMGRRSRSGSVRIRLCARLPDAEIADGTEDLTLQWNAQL